MWRELSNLYEGDIPVDLRKRIERHLQGCVHCRAIYDGVRNTVSLVADDRSFELPAALSERLYARLGRYLKNK